MESSIPYFETLSSLDLLSAMFNLELPPRSFSLRTLFPLTVDLGVTNETGQHESLVTGVLEITQDVTEDYATIVRFQWLLLGTCLGSSTILFALLQFFILKAERMLMERMVRTQKLEAELHQNEKLASMGRVIASIAHEIRNPLGIIRSSSELLLRRMGSDAQASSKEAGNRKILSAIYDESCRLSQIVTDFLDYARPRMPRQDTVDMNALLSQALGFLEGEMHRVGVEYVRHTPPELLVRGDKDLLYRAIYNIIVNAYQAIGHDGVIRIRGRILDEGMVEIAFHDSGPGFPPEAMQRLLDPFFTTKDNGTGLGLPIVNTIISSHGGRLELTNPEGGGAQVVILLPVASNENISNTQETARDPNEGRPA